MHAKARAAFWAGSFCGFLVHKPTRSNSLDALQVCNDTYPVPGAVTQVKMEQFSARIIGAGIAELIPAGGELFTILDGTIKARVRLVAGFPPAAGTGIAIPDIGAAQAAVYAARRNAQRIIFGNFFNLGWQPSLQSLYAISLFQPSAILMRSPSGGWS